MTGTGRMVVGVLGRNSTGWWAADPNYCSLASTSVFSV